MSGKSHRSKNLYDRATHTSHIVSLHRWLWEQANGPIPEGGVIHHRDGDNQNNALGNLQLVTESEHRRIHEGWVQDASGRWFKRCPTCGLMKDAEAEFYWRSRNRPVVHCKPCHATRERDRNRALRAAGIPKRKRVREEGLRLLKEAAR